MSGDNPNAPESLNTLVRILLRTPLHWLISHNTMLLRVTGRKTGRLYNIPVSYTRDGNDLVTFTDAPWWKNLREAPVTVAIRGRRRRGTARATFGAAVAEPLARHLDKVPRDAKYLGVRLGRGRKPVAGDVARSALNTAMIRVTLDDPGAR
jgi:deazaflavin-dependent oxidoreductase (nitroreductase family)